MYFNEFRYILDIVPWFDAPVPYGVPYEQAVPPRPPATLSVCKTHCHLSELRWRESVPNHGAKHICVIRDPKEICVSLYHFNKIVALGPASPPLDVFVRMIADSRFHTVGSWPERIAYEWAHRNDADVLVLFYEDLVNCKRESVRQLAAFLDVELSEAQLDRVCHVTSLRWMKAHTHLVDPGTFTALAYEGHMVRSGKADGGKLGLSIEQRKRIDDAMLQRLADLLISNPIFSMYIDKDI